MSDLTHYDEMQRVAEVTAKLRGNSWSSNLMPDVVRAAMAKLAVFKVQVEMHKAKAEYMA